MNHLRKTYKLYKSRIVKNGCPFCEPDTKARAIAENDTMYVVKNLTKYDLWEAYDVEHHLLIIPKKHRESLKDMSDKERKDHIDIAADYEKKGYSVYARGKGFVKRSVDHQHTHLIKATNKKPKFLFYLHRPYIVFKR